MSKLAMTKAVAKLNNLRIAPRKVRLVANIIKKQPVNEALAQLQVMPWRSAPVIYKLLKSAVANAKNKNMKVEKLVVESITVDQGPMLKRYLPRAMGRATPIHKKMSHLTLILGEQESLQPKYTIYEATKKIKQAKIRKESKNKFKEEKVVGKETKPGFFQKLFRRKAI
jgi:large subunit ribosomal protein L22